MLNLRVSVHLHAYDFQILPFPVTFDRHKILVQALYILKCIGMSRFFKRGADLLFELVQCKCLEVLAEDQCAPPVKYFECLKDEIWITAVHLEYSVTVSREIRRIYKNLIIAVIVPCCRLQKFKSLHYTYLMHIQRQIIILEIVRDEFLRPIRKIDARRRHAAKN